MAQLGPTILTLQTDVRRQGGTPIARIWEWVDGTLKWQDTCAGSSNRGYATLTLPADSPIIGLIAELQVIRIDQPQPAGSAVPFKTWEYRITELDDAAADPNVVVTCAPIINDFARVLLRTVNGGVPTKLTTFTGTPDQFINALLLPALVAQGKTGISAGTIDVGPAMQFSQRNASVLSVGSFLEQTYTKDFFLERVDDTTDLLHFTTRGAGLASPRAILGRNVRELKRTILVDDGVFANVVEAEGVTANGETEPSSIAQAAWLAESKSGTVIAVADPLGGTGPVAIDDELNGKRALYALDPLHLSPSPLLKTGSTTGYRTFPSCPVALALDTSRRLLWGYTQDDTDTIWWRDLVDDENRGTVSLGAGAKWIVGMGYDAVNDRIVCACGDVAKVVIVNASTKAVAGTVTSADIPAALCGVAHGHAFIGYLGTAEFDVIDCSGSGSVQGTLSNTGAYDGRGSAVVYHTSTGRYFAFSGGAAYSWYTASSLAAISTSSSAPAAEPYAVCTDSAQTAIALLSASHYCTVAPSTGVLTSTATPPFPYAPTGMFGAPLALFDFHARAYLLTTSLIVGYDPSGNAWLTPGADVGRASTGAQGTTGYAVEPGPSSPENATVYTSDMGTVRRFVLTQSEDLVSPFEAFDIVDSDASAETITAPASGSGGPVNIPVEADAAGQGALIEIREDAALDYRTQLEDPSSIASAGEVSSSPQFGVLAKRNYWRGSTFDSGTWRTDRTNRWMSTIRQVPSRFGDMETRWSQADQTGVAFQPITLTADWTQDATTPDLTLSVTGLNSGEVLSPGDYITINPKFANERGWFVRGRTVADSGGNATIPVTPRTSVDSTVTSGTTVYLSTPSLLLANGRPDGLALYPNRDPVFGQYIWPRYSALVPVPRLVGDQRAWVVAHVSLANYSFSPVDMQLRVWPPYMGTPLNAFHDPDSSPPTINQWPQVVHPTDNPQLTTGELREYWLSQPLDTINYPSHGFMRAELTVAATSAMATGRMGVIYVHSLQVVLAAQTTQPRDLYGAEGPIALEQLAAARLLAVHNPTQNFQLSVVEDDVARPWEVGAIATVRDPQREISVQNDSSRIISVTRYGKLPDAQFEAPDVEIGHAPLNTFVPGIVTTDSTVKNPTPPLLPGSPLPGGVGGGGGTGGGGGGIKDMPAMFLEGAAGPFHQQNQYNWDTGLILSPTGGRGGGPTWLSLNNDGKGVFFNSGEGTKEGHCLIVLNLDSLTLDADGQMLLQLINVNDSGALHLVFGLDPSRHFVAYRSDSAGEVQIGPTATTAVPSSGFYLIDVGFLIDPAAGYVTARGFDLSAGSTIVSTLLLDARGENTLSDNASGVPEDIEAFTWGADWLTSTVFTVGGIDNIRLSGFGVFDATGFTADDYVGDVMSGSLFANSNGHYADAPSMTWQVLNNEDNAGQLRRGRMTTAAQKNSFGISTFSNVASVLAIEPSITMGSESFDPAAIRIGIRSGTTDADNGVDLSPYGGAWASGLVGPGSGYVRGNYFRFDPATAAAWTNTAAQNAEIFLALQTSKVVLVPQACAKLVYRPTAGTHGFSSVGSAVVPITPIDWLDLNSMNTSGQSVHFQYYAGSDDFGYPPPTSAVYTMGDFATHATAGPDGRRAFYIDSTYPDPFIGGTPAERPRVMLANGGASYAMPESEFAFGLPSTVIENASKGTATIWFNMNGVTLTSDIPILRFFDRVNGLEYLRVMLSTSRQVYIKRTIYSSFSPPTRSGYSPPLVSPSTVFSSTGLNQLEVEVGIDGSNGVLNVWRIDTGGTRTLIANATGLNTKAGGFFFGAVAAFGVYPDTSSDGITFSDVVVASLGTSAFGTGIGGCISATLLANAVGAHNDSGGPYTKVTDDNGSGGTPDGDYNILTGAGQIDTYKVAAKPSDASTILGIRGNVYVSKPFGTGTATDNGRAVVIVDGVEYYGPIVSMGNPTGGSNGNWPEGEHSGNTSRQIFGPLYLSHSPADGSALAGSMFSGSNAEGGWKQETHAHFDQWIRQVTISMLYAWTH